MNLKRVLVAVLTMALILSGMPFGSIVFAEEVRIEEVYMVATTNEELPTGPDDPDILSGALDIGTEFYLWGMTSPVNELVGAEIWLEFDPDKLSVVDMDQTAEGVQPVKVPAAANPNEVSIYEVTANELNTVEGGIIKFAASNKAPSSFENGAVIIKSKFRVNAELVDGLWVNYHKVELRGKLGTDGNPIFIGPENWANFWMGRDLNIVEPTQPIVEVYDEASGKYTASFDVEILPTLIASLDHVNVWLQRHNSSDYKAGELSWNAEHTKLIAHFEKVEAGDYMLEAEGQNVYKNIEISVQSIDSKPVINTISRKFPANFQNYGFEINGQNLDKLSSNTVLELWKNNTLRAATNIRSGNMTIENGMLRGEFCAVDDTSMEAGTYEIRLNGAGADWSEVNGDRVKLAVFTTEPILYGWYSPDSIGTGIDQYQIKFHGANLADIDPSDVVVELWDWSNDTAPFEVASGADINIDNYGVQGDIVASFNVRTPDINDHYTAIVKLNGNVLTREGGMHVRVVNYPVVYGFNREVFEGEAPYQMSFFGYNLDSDEEFFLKIFRNGNLMQDNIQLDVVSNNELTYTIDDTLAAGWYDFEVWHGPTEWEPNGWRIFNDGVEIHSNDTIIHGIWDAAIEAGSTEFALTFFGNNLQKLEGTIIELQKQDGTTVATTGLDGVDIFDGGYDMDLYFDSISPSGIPEYNGYKLAIYRMENGEQIPVTDCTIEPYITIDATTDPFVGGYIRPGSLQSGLNYPVDINFSLENEQNLSSNAVLIATLEYEDQVWTSTSVVRNTSYTDRYIAHFDIDSDNPLPQIQSDEYKELKLNVYVDEVNSSNMLRSNRFLSLSTRPQIYDIKITPRESGRTSYTVELSGWNLIPEHTYTIKYSIDNTYVDTFDVVSTADGTKIIFTWDTSKGVPATGLPPSDNHRFEIFDGTTKFSSWGFGMNEPNPQIGGAIWFAPYYIQQGYPSNTMITIKDMEDGTLWSASDNLTVKLTVYPDRVPNNVISVNNITINEDTIVMQMPENMQSGIYRIGVLKDGALLADNIFRVLGSGTIPKIYIGSSTSGGVTNQNWVEGRLITSDPTVPVTIKLNGVAVQTGIMADPDGFYRYRVDGLQPGANQIAAEATNAKGTGSRSTTVTYNAPQAPAAPTNGIVDDVADTFTFTKNPSYPNIADYKYTLNNGTSWSNCTSNVINVGNVAIPAGHVQVRVKADSGTGRPEGLKLVSNAEFTISTASTFIQIEDKMIKENGTAQVAISADDVLGMTGATFTVQYNPAVAVVESITPGSLATGAFVPNVANAANGIVTLSFANVTPVNGDGTICILNFRAVGAIGTSTPVNITNHMFEAGANQILVSIQAGELEVIPPIMYGDVNNSGSVTTFDATLILQHLAEIIVLTPEQQLAADVNGSGSVTTFDATLILQKLAEIIDEFPVELND